MRITINTSSFGKFDPTPIEQLQKKGIEFSLNPFKRQMTEDEVIEFSKGVEGVIAGNEPLTNRVLENLPELRVISRCGVGQDNVDLQAAQRLGIKVFNTPDAPTVSAAELTVALILNLLRKVSLMDQNLKKGVWQKHMGNLLSGKKVGIIGFGRIGQTVARLLLAFGVEIRFYDIQEITTDLPCETCEFDDLIQWADIITLHLSTDKQNEFLISQKEIASMKKGSWLINVARGTLVDEEALSKALEGGHLAGAALDVFGREPYEGPLTYLENVILTPHVGSYAVESRINMEIQTVENLIQGLKA